MDPHQIEPKEDRQLIETNFKLQREHSDEMPYPIDRQVDALVSNIKFYVCLLISNSAAVGEVQQIKKNLVVQLEFINSDYIHTQKIQKFSEIMPISNVQLNQNQVENYTGFSKVQQFGEVIKKLMAMKADTESQEQFENLNKIIEGFLKQMELIILEDNYAVSRLQKYEILDNNLEKTVSSNDKEVEELPPDHYWRKQKIIFRKWQPAKVFQWVQPPLHRVYLSQVTKVYHDVVPFKMKFICLNSLDEPKIARDNYFNQDIDPEKAVMHYCVPNSKTLITYRIEDICKLLTIQKEYATQKQLAINWTFTPDARTVITPDGRIFGINCRTTDQKQDSSLYQITTEKASNRGRIPQPRRNSAIVYCNKSIYIIGGNNDKEKCSAKNYKYSLRQKKWIQVSDSNVALRKPTVCVYKDRYLFKIGGINEFDYINKEIELYDTTTDRWSVVRATPKNILEQVQILQDSLAVQIAQDQIYVFAGKNANGFRHDTGLVLQIMEIREKIKAPAKVAGQLWNVSIGKKNVLSFFGLFSQSNVIAHGNCLYAMRQETCKLQRF